MSCHQNLARRLAGGALAFAIAAAASGAFAGETPPSPDSAGGASSPGDPISAYLAHYEEHVHAAQASQPHWMTPVATVTPRLEQEFRYDELWEHQGNGGDLTVDDGGKGLELIPTQTNEVLINLPPYQDRANRRPASGLGDWSFLTIKQRFLSADEAHGNYILTGFLGFQGPTGIAKFTNDAWMVTPTLAAGKGWGNWDIQATVGVPIPLAHERAIGLAIVSNTTLQYHLGKYLWPEIEANLTHWTDGPRADKTQVFVTPGLILGRFQLTRATKFIIGAGYQIAVTPKMTTIPVLTPTWRQAWILTTRLAF
jgi:hypothetical protein